jgi:hypothetical protein
MILQLIGEGFAVSFGLFLFLCAAIGFLAIAVCIFKEVTEDGD